MEVCFRAMGCCRSPRGRVAVGGVVFVDENINLPALKHSRSSLSVRRTSAILRLRPCRPSFVLEILLVCHGVAPCLLPSPFTPFLFAPVERGRALVEKTAQAVYDYRRREVAVEPAVPARAETVEEKQQFVGLEVMELRGDYLCGLGELVPVGLAFQPLEIAKLVKLRHKPCLRRCYAIADIQL